MSWRPIDKSHRCEFQMHHFCIPPKMNRRKISVQPRECLEIATITITKIIENRMTK